MAEWKDKFLERYSELTDIEKFKEVSLKPMRKSIRTNTIKTTIEVIKERFGDSLEQVPWCKEGFFIKKKGVGNTLEHYLGYIYLQGAASMIPPVVLQPKEGDMVLDMCASPGSKTSQMAAMMNNKGMIVANDSILQRLKPLTMNLQRCGVINTVITKMEGRRFKTNFDKILVDAPCSGMGTIRKSYKTIKMWNPNTIKRMAGVQKQLIKTGFDNLNEGGTMVYSTCTLEPHENESVVNFLLENYDNAKIEKINIEMKRGKSVDEFEGECYDSDVKKCLRIWPQDNDTEGFFVARIKKV
ncbi:NOL1/NOP2/sun family putative RNA methylase [archaeon]|jgi:tRNA (cytosine49-C5)-methyltransferase|nr:NOL1/NOP2/sun family putative RNA methylase [archaeon]MBT3731232.1 NOL1/NOP2/sun family putative RNA methylase [archaeon]MBT4670014.1 NOL1/NOP2/sun family putative RNA methylase [archaeon]MBT5287784.1 NOL1/NOP2/sun family putative RNA methylase [archaeon]MBT7052789.1 NOL1/NOP2/sun family putative RNA methylase [archaeon]